MADTPSPAKPPTSPRVLHDGLQNSFSHSSATTSLPITSRPATVGSYIMPSPLDRKRSQPLPPPRDAASQGTFPPAESSSQRRTSDVAAGQSMPDGYPSSSWSARPMTAGGALQFTPGHAAGPSSLPQRQPQPPTSQQNYPFRWQPLLQPPPPSVPMRFPPQPASLPAYGQPSPMVSGSSLDQYPPQTGSSVIDWRRSISSSGTGSYSATLANSTPSSADILPWGVAGPSQVDGPSTQPTGPSSPLQQIQSADDDMADGEVEVKMEGPPSPGTTARREKRREQNRAAQRTFRAKTKMHQQETTEHVEHLENLTRSQEAKIKQQEAIIIGLRAENDLLRKATATLDLGRRTVSQPAAMAFGEGYLSVDGSSGPGSGSGSAGGSRAGIGVGRGSFDSGRPMMDGHMPGGDLGPYIDGDQWRDTGQGG